MEKRLKEITNLTINEVLNCEIILPSFYFEKFNYNAKNLEIDLNDKEFEKELSKTLLKDFDKIQDYMNLIINNISNLKEVSNDAKEAIKANDIESLDNIYTKMILLEKELNVLNNKLFVDELTNTKNRKWIYKEFLNDNSTFKTNGTLVLIDLKDFYYIRNEYGELLSNNYLIFITNFIAMKLKDEKIDFNIARFLENKFFIFISETDYNFINSIIFNIQKILFNTNLKSNSGLMIKGNFKFKIQNYKQNNQSNEIFEILFNQLKEE